LTLNLYAEITVSLGKFPYKSLHFYEIRYFFVSSNPSIHLEGRVSKIRREPRS